MATIHRTCRWAAGLLAASLVGTALAGSMPTLWVETVDFDIPEQSATTGLRTFAEQANVQVLFAHDAVRAVRTNEFRGRAGRARALEAILAGTGLESAIGPRDTATVRLAHPLIGPTTVASPRTLAGSSDTTQSSAPASVSALPSPSVAPPQERQGSGDVAGTVTLAGGTRLQGALIAARGTNARTYTDREGRYVLRNVPAGSQELVFQSALANEAVRRVDVSAGSSTTIDVTLEPSTPQASALEEVTVIASARQLSLQAERGYVGKKNVITSTKIGEFPDINAAEAAARLPGVYLESTDRGEGRFVSIRGAPPTFNRVKVNGFAIGSTELNGSSVPLDLFPAGQIGEIQVTKSVLPSEDANSIGGEINLSLPTAFGKDPRTTFQLQTGRAEYGRDRDRYGGAFAASRVFGSDDQFGLTASAHYDRRAVTADAIRVSDWDQTSRLAGAGEPFAIDDMELRSYDNVRENLSASLVFEWKMTEATTAFAQASINRFDELEVRHRYIQELDDGGTLLDDGSAIVRESASGPASVVRGTFSNIRNTRRDWQIDDTPQELLLFGVGAETRLPNWTLAYKAGFSDASEHRLIDFLRFDMERGATVQFDASEDQRRPRLTPVSGPSPFDANAFTLGEISKQKSFRDDEIATLDLSATRFFDLAESNVFELSFGARATLRDRGLDEDNVNWNGTSTLSLADPRIAWSDENKNLLGVYDYGPSVRRGDVGFLFADPDAFLPFDATRTRIRGAISDYTAKEDVYAAFLQGKYVRGPYTIVTGARIERTDLKVRGFGVTENDEIVPLNEQNDYADVFPSLHLRWDITRTLVARGSASRTLSRPSFTDLAPSADIDVAAQEISIGNPTLEPFYSNNLDLSLDWYSERYGTIGVALFYKGIDGFVVDTEDLVVGGPFDGFTRSSVANAEQGKIEGIELSYTKQFSELPGIWSGLGLQMNLTLANSEVEFPETGGSARAFGATTAPLAGQADRACNAAIWYAGRRLFLQAAYSETSDFLVSYNDTFEDRFSNGSERLGFKAIFNVTPQYAVEFNWANITNDKLWYFLGDRARLRDYERSGATYDLTLRATF